eukprot:TRINITY_DN114146_c0_g1_i1.p1 TRINITY_DN114146_c0_g1~~TRINITY_DN114146_c0_g1_i1.p1  ORF type:complete len:557 (+),score=78.99 TRINITY_DN114146_c0_g1_i1:29-1699(+)
MQKGLLLLLVVAVCHAQLPPTVTVTTPLGKITGRKTGIGPSPCHSFRGIPFAEPSSYVGTMRFAEAQMKHPWTDSIDATEFKAACPQNCIEEPKTCPTTFDEQCLYLNVWAPANAKPGDKYPVAIFYHGGNYRRESASEVLYWGGDMCSQSNTIIVTADYRLGALGFFAHPDLTELPTNVGIRDQRLSMAWVQKNIASFGGDPRQVTIFGQSAGAGSMLIHYTTPEVTKGLFSAIVSQSNPAAIEYKNVNETAQYGAKISRLLKCENVDPKKELECLRSVNWVQFLIAQTQVAAAEGKIPFPKIFEHAYPYSPAVGTKEIPVQPLTRAAQGHFDPTIPFMTGFDKDDALQFVWGFFPKPVPEIEYKAAIDIIFGFKHAAEILKQYPVPTKEKDDARHVMSRLTTDYAFACANRYIAQKASITSKAGIYMYNYTHALSFNGWGKKFIECLGYVCHGSEIPIEFNSAQLAGFKISKDEEWLSNFMSQIWFDKFRTNGTANKPIQGQGVPDWHSLPKVWTKDTKTPVYILQAPAGAVRVDTDILSEKCKLWDKVGYLKA